MLKYKHIKPTSTSLIQRITYKGTKIQSTNFSFDILPLLQFDMSATFKHLTKQFSLVPD